MSSFSFANLINIRLQFRVVTLLIHLYCMNTLKRSDSFIIVFDNHKNGNLKDIGCKYKYQQLLDILQLL